MLVLRIASANFNEDRDLIGKMSTRASFKMGKMKFKTALAKDKGVSPKWYD